jgi:hypothetical protein
MAMAENATANIRQARAKLINLSSSGSFITKIYSTHHILIIVI